MCSCDWKEKAAPHAGCGAAVGRSGAAVGCSEPQRPPWVAVAARGVLHRFEGPKPFVKSPQKDFKIDKAKFYLNKN